MSAYHLQIRHGPAPNYMIKVLIAPRPLKLIAWNEFLPTSKPNVAGDGKLFPVMACAPHGMLFQYPAGSP